MSDNPKMHEVTFSLAELAVRIAEAYAEMQRPESMNPREALEAMEPLPRAANLRAARAAIDYFTEQIADQLPHVIEEHKVN